jgi:hypothetical protein
MWHGDETFGEILRQHLRFSPFIQLPHDISSEHAATPVTLLDRLVQAFHSPEARDASEVVIIWALARPYVHSDGNREPSTIIYIEKTINSIAWRWPRRYLRYLTTDDGNGGPSSLPDTLRQRAWLDWNWSFYSEAIRRHGPLVIWWATVRRLNEASGLSLRGPREWERRLNEGYRASYGCLPLKNRRI